MYYWRRYIINMNPQINGENTDCTEDCAKKNWLISYRKMMDPYFTTYRRPTTDELKTWT